MCVSDATTAPMNSYNQRSKLFITHVLLGARGSIDFSGRGSACRNLYKVQIRHGVDTSSRNFSCNVIRFT